ncbi:oxidoreductase, partial [Pseudomonas sp. GW460-13]
LSMIRWCVEHGREWRLLYCVRSRGGAAYLDRLASHADRVVVHADDEHRGERVDLGAALREMPAGWHVYCCGPGPMMDAVSDCGRAAGIESGAVHFERFGADADRSDKPDGAFEVSLLRHGGRFTIPAGDSILSVLE